MALIDIRGQAKRRTPDELIQHLNSFELELKFSAGVWFFSPGGGRFHSPEQTEASLYILKMYGYQGYFGIDINPERMPVEQALRNCMDALRAANDRINSLDHEKVIWATTHPDKARGWLEAYLIRKRAMHPENLPPLEELQMG